MGSIAAPRDRTMVPEVSIGSEIGEDSFDGCPAREVFVFDNVARVRPRAVLTNRRSGPGYLTA